MKQIRLKIKTKTQEYPIVIGHNLTANILNISKKNSLTFNRCLLVIDNNISKNKVNE